MASLPSTPSAASVPSTVSRPSGPDGFLQGDEALSDAERQALLNRIQAELQGDGLQTVSADSLESLLAEFL